MIGQGDERDPAGRLNLHGGIIVSVESLEVQTTGVLDIESPGWMWIWGDVRNHINNLISQGRITAYDGNGTVVVTLMGPNTKLDGSFDPAIARDPSPRNHAQNVAKDTDLSWTAGDYAQDVDGHAVYFGTTDPPPFIQYRSGTSYDPGILELGQTYYWRITEVNDTHLSSPWKGNLWTFEIANFLLVDDFEDYNNLGELQVAWVGADHLAYGRMGLDYDGPSSASRTFGSPQDWTEENVKALDLYFRGDSNQAEQMYMTLEDGITSGTVIYGDANDLTTNDWTVWQIELQDFGINLENVTNITIGFGDVGGAGTVYFDDIRLYPPRCMGEVYLDLNGDCIVDFEDFAEYAGSWQESGILR